MIIGSTKGHLTSPHLSSLVYVTVLEGSSTLEEQCSTGEIVPLKTVHSVEDDAQLHALLHSATRTFQGTATLSAISSLLLATAASMSAKHGSSGTDLTLAPDWLPIVWIVSILKFDSTAPVIYSFHDATSDIGSYKSSPSTLGNLISSCVCVCVCVFF